MAKLKVKDAYAFLMAVQDYAELLDDIELMEKDLASGNLSEADRKSTEEKLSEKRSKSKELSNRTL
jgi:hypothetical protein